MSLDNSHVSQQELEQYLWGAATLLGEALTLENTKISFFP